MSVFKYHVFTVSAVKSEFTQHMLLFARENVKMACKAREWAACVGNPPTVTFQQEVWSLTNPS